MQVLIIKLKILFYLHRVAVESFTMQNSQIGYVKQSISLEMAMLLIYPL